MFSAEAIRSKPVIEPKLFKNPSNDAAVSFNGAAVVDSPELVDDEARFFFFFVFFFGTSLGTLLQDPRVVAAFAGVAWGLAGEEEDGAGGFVEA